MLREGCVLIFGELKMDQNLIKEMADQLCVKLRNLIKSKNVLANFGILIDFEVVSPEITLCLPPNLGQN